MKKAEPPIRSYLFEPWRGVGRLWVLALLFPFAVAEQVSIFPSLSFFLLAIVLGVGAYLVLMWHNFAFQTAIKAWALPQALYFGLSIPFAEDLVQAVLFAIFAAWFWWSVLSGPVLIEFRDDAVRLACLPCGWRLRYENIAAIEEPNDHHRYVKLILKEPERDLLNSWTGKVRFRVFSVSEANMPEALAFLRDRIAATG